MKIVFVLPDMPGGGTERVVALLANEYIKMGYEVSILLFAGEKTAYPLDERIEIVRAGEASDGSLSVRIKRLFCMRRFYRKNKGCTIFAFSAMGAVFSVIATVGIPHKLIVSERNDPSRYEHQKIRNWAYGKADRLILQTEDMKHYFPSAWKDKMAIIPNPVSDDMPLPYEGERKKRIVSAARLQPQKNQKLLITAFADFLRDYPDYELHLFGVGELEKELKELTKESGIERNVYFRGFSPKVREEMRDSAMFVLSSDYEGISNSMIEALAIGIPVISTDCPVGGSRMYIEDGVSGLLTPVGDEKALARAMKKVAGDEEFAKSLSINGRKVREKYHISKIAVRFLEEAGI